MGNDASIGQDHLLIVLLVYCLMLCAGVVLVINNSLKNLKSFFQQVFTPINCGIMTNNQLIIMKTSSLHVESSTTNYKELIQLLTL